MTDFSTQLSAYLDGELDPSAASAVEERLAADPAAQAELDALIAADVLAQEAFEAELNAPVPFALAQQIKSAPMPEPEAPKARPVWGALAASLVVFALGGIGGYALKGQNTPVQTAGWLADIADYHAIYASQVRHLVEVGADESDHIENWLGNTVGATFSIPDLTEFGLTFEGGRLVVANGKPVAQLMYRDADGVVVALCLQRTSKTPPATPTFNEQTINGFDFVSWTAGEADYVVIGPSGQPDLNAIAGAAALDI
ncbi:anti-sigma factor [Yoonia sp. GPGPB17]|uniref:anti-sigma factor family protein n=1 Tax=Yoonia sp. GPGPB17 TaxID=3026147 RepID=UPI0030C19A79